MMELCLAPNVTENRTYGLRFYGCVLSLCLFPVMCGLGLVLNSVVVVIFARALIKKPLDQQLLPYLLTLSVADSIQLLLSALLIYPQEMMSYEWNVLEHLDFLTFYVYSLLSLYPILMMAKCASVWLKVMICIRRFVALFWPFSMMKYRLLRRNGLAIFTVLSAAFLVNFCRFWEYKIVYLEENGTEYDGQVIWGYNLLSHHAYNVIMDIVVYLFFIFLIPFLLLSVMNIAIFCKIISARKQLSALSTSGQKQERRSNYMVITIILIFLTCQSLGLAQRLLEVAGVEKSSVEMTFMRNLSNILINLNSALNPFIYCIFTRNFRDFTHSMRHHKARAVSRISSFGRSRAGSVDKTKLQSRSGGQQSARLLYAGEHLSSGTNV